MGDAAIVGDSVYERRNPRLVLKRGKGAVDGEQDLLQQILLKRGIGLVGGGDARQPLAIVADDPLDASHMRASSLGAAARPYKIYFRGPL